MTENDHRDPILEESERMLARTFEAWRAEFRSILEDHRREIQARLEKIEREIEKKSDKENVELIARGIREELCRHAEDIKNLYAGLNNKMGTETMWKVVTLVLALSGVLGGIVGFIVRLFAGK